MFSITHTVISPDELKKKLETPHAGAFVSFEGWVRDHNNGRKVKKLKYECYETLAISEGNIIIEEAKKKFSFYNALALHRVGVLNIGEMAVWVGVVSTHRKDAFQTCEYIINAIKLRVPLWKKEFYEKEDARWIMK